MDSVVSMHLHTPSIQTSGFHEWRYHEKPWHHAYFKSASIIVFVARTRNPNVCAWTSWVKIRNRSSFTVHLCRRPSISLRAFVEKNQSRFWDWLELYVPNRRETRSKKQENLLNCNVNKYGLSDLLLLLPIFFSITSSTFLIYNCDLAFLHAYLWGEWWKRVKLENRFASSGVFKVESGMKNAMKII